MFDTLVLNANALAFKGMMLMNGFLAAGGTGGTGGTGGAGGAGGNNWSIGGFLKALQGSITVYVKWIILIIGLVMVGFGIYQIAKNLISGGKGQTNWVTTFLLLIVGGTLMLGSGWGVIKNISKGSSHTLDEMGKGNADDGAAAPTDNYEP